MVWGAQVKHVIAQLKAHASAEVMLQELQAILDEDAELFVMKLYRAVLFDVTKLCKFGSL